MSTKFTIGKVTVDVLDGTHPFAGVPPSQWRGDRKERLAQAVLGNLEADDGLRAQVSLVTWPENEEVSLGHTELFAGPSDYDRLEDAGLISPKLLDNKLVARIRALRYGDASRATGAAIEWQQVDEWSGGDSRATLATLGATRTGTYGELNPGAARFKTEPAIEVPLDNPVALFAVYALTRVMPIMTGFGKAAVEGPNA